MKLYQDVKNDRWKIVISVIVFCFLIVMYLLNSASIEKSSKENGIIATENAIKRAVINCYAIEGSYPQNIKYLEEKYGIMVNKDYIVIYDVLGSNTMPYISVVEKGNVIE